MELLVKVMLHEFKLQHNVAHMVDTLLGLVRPRQTSQEF